MANKVWMVVVAGALVGLVGRAAAVDVVTNAGLVGSFCQTKAKTVVFRAPKKGKTCPKAGADGQSCSGGTGCIANCCKSGESLVNLTGADAKQGLAGANGTNGTNAFDTLPSGKTVHGAIGMDLQATGALNDFGIIAELPIAAPAPIKDTDVIVVIVDAAATGWGANNDSPPDVLPTESNSNHNKRTDTMINSCASASAPVATTPCCPGTTVAPTAAAGKVCIYVSGGTNVVNLHGTSILNGPTGASPNGFKMNWENTGAGESYIDAVWAYTAP